MYFVSKSVLSVYQSVFLTLIVAKNCYFVLSEEFNLVCNIAGRSLDLGFPIKSIPVENCSHLVLFDFLLFQDILVPKNATNTNYYVHQLLHLKNTRNKGLKILIGMMGQQYEISFWDSAAITKKRFKFIRSVADLVSEYNLDGIALPWLHSQQFMGTEIADCELAKELRRVLPETQYTLAIIVYFESFAGGPRYKPTIIDDMATVFDHIYVMGTELSNSKGIISHSQLCSKENGNSLSIDNTIKTFIRIGVPKEKILLGIPFYGRSIARILDKPRTVEAVDASESLSRVPRILYRELCQTLSAQLSQRRFDAIAKTPYLETDRQWIVYDDEESIEWKVKFTRDKGLGGIAVWTLDYDDFDGNCNHGQAYPLFNQVVESLHHNIYRSISNQSVTDYCLTNSSHEDVNNRWMLIAYLSLTILTVAIFSIGFVFGIQRMRRGKKPNTNRRGKVKEENIAHEKSVSGLINSSEESKRLFYDQAITLSDVPGNMEEISISQTNNLTVNKKVSFEAIMSSWEIPEDQVVWGQQIGSGSYGTVFKGSCGITPVALKKLNISRPERDTASIMKSFKREVALLSHSSHPNILRFMGFIRGQTTIITEWCPASTLYHHLHVEQEEFDQKTICGIVLQLSIGMDFIHSKGIIHRDLKSSNIFCDVCQTNDVRVKIGDFGLATMKSSVTNFGTDSVSSSTTLLNSGIISLDINSTTAAGGVKGSVLWMAPELLGESPPAYSSKSDVYSFGIILFELTSGTLPYQSMFRDAIMYLVGSKKLRPDFTLLRKETSPILVNILEKCTDFTPGNRPTFSEIYSILNETV